MTYCSNIGVAIAKGWPARHMLCVAPVGSCREHLSECCPSMFMEREARPSCWHQDWALAGTRPLHDPHGRPKKLMWPVSRGQQQVLAVLHDADFESVQLNWKTWLDPKLELDMTGGTDRQKRAGRKQVRELTTVRIFVEDRKQVPSNKTQFLHRWFVEFGLPITLICFFDLTCTGGPCPPPPSVCILLRDFWVRGARHRHIHIIYELFRLDLSLPPILMSPRGQV